MARPRGGSIIDGFDSVELMTEIHRRQRGRDAQARI
jgi:hypothetical protein